MLLKSTLVLGIFEVSLFYTKTLLAPCSLLRREGTYNTFTFSICCQIFFNISLSFVFSSCELRIRHVLDFLILLSEVLNLFDLFHLLIFFFNLQSSTCGPGAIPVTQGAAPGTVPSALWLFPCDVPQCHRVLSAMLAFSLAFALHMRLPT